MEWNILLNFFDDVSRIDLGSEKGFDGSCTAKGVMEGNIEIDLRKEGYPLGPFGFPGQGDRGLIVDG